MADGQEEKKVDFDVKIMVDSFRKALDTKEIIETKIEGLTKDDIKDLAITFFEQSMRNISENRKRKQEETDGYFQG